MPPRSKHGDIPGADPDLRLGGRNYVMGVWGPHKFYIFRLHGGHGGMFAPAYNGQRSEGGPSEADDIFSFQRLIS